MIKKITYIVFILGLLSFEETLPIMAQSQENVKMGRILNALGNSQKASNSKKNSVDISSVLNSVQTAKEDTRETIRKGSKGNSSDDKEDIKALRVLNSLQNNDGTSLRIGNTDNSGFFGVLNTIDSEEGLAAMTDMMQTVNSSDESETIMDVLTLVAPADAGGTADAIITEYYAAPETYEANLVNAILDSFSSSNVLDYISGAYNDNYYDNGFWGREGQNATLSLYKGAIPKYDPEDFYRPVWGRITSNFGFRSSFGRMHKGVDLALNVGDTVRAALPGVVGRVGYEAGGYGNFVVVAHSNGVESRYAHLNESLVVPGQRVEAGQAIALGGNTGNSTGPHLHFEIRYMGAPMDPLALFDFNGRNFNRVGKTGGLQQQNKLATGLNGTKTSLKDKSTYVVRQGDTVKSVAKRAGISTLRLCQLNFITEDTPLQPGAMLKLK